jgi:hypothetical protein
MSYKKNNGQSQTNIKVGDKIENSHKLPSSELPPPPPPKKKED